MTIIGVDRAGDFLKQDVTFVAVKFTGQQNHRAIFLHRDYQKSFVGKEHWQEKVAAACIFRVITLDELYRESDDIQIDKDYPKKTRDYVEKRIRRLLGLKYRQNRLTVNPQIQWIPKNFSKVVEDADWKSKRAYHRKIKRLENPNLDYELSLMS